jgi:hypothetical protein
VLIPHPNRPVQFSYFRPLAFLPVFFALQCESTSAIHLRQKLPGPYSLQETITLYLIDAEPLPEQEWQAEADRLNLLRKQENRCRDWNNEGVYRALIELRQKQKVEMKSSAMSILEEAARICRNRIIEENYRAIFYLNGRTSMPIMMESEQLTESSIEGLRFCPDMERQQRRRDRAQGSCFSSADSGLTWNGSGEERIDRHL